MEHKHGAIGPFLFIFNKDSLFLTLRLVGQFMWNLWGLSLADISAFLLLAFLVFNSFLGQRITQKKMFLVISSLKELFHLFFQKQLTSSLSHSHQIPQAAEKGRLLQIAQDGKQIYQNFAVPLYSLLFLALLILMGGVKDI